jgi:hypothetical protein
MKFTLGALVALLLATGGCCVDGGYRTCEPACSPCETTYVETAPTYVSRPAYYCAPRPTVYVARPAHRAPRPTVYHTNVVVKTSSPATHSSGSFHGHSTSSTHSHH